MERIFKRKVYQQLLEWKETENGRTAILVEGARRVGKSTIAEEFARNEYDSYIVVDFADAPAAVPAGQAGGGPEEMHCLRPVREGLSRAGKGCAFRQRPEGGI